MSDFDRLDDISKFEELDDYFKEDSSGLDTSSLYSMPDIDTNINIDGLLSDIDKDMSKNVEEEHMNSLFTDDSYEEVKTPEKRPEQKISHQPEKPAPKNTVRNVAQRPKQRTAHRTVHHKTVHHKHESKNRDAKPFKANQNPNMNSGPDILKKHGIDIDSLGKTIMDSLDIDDKNASSTAANPAKPLFEKKENIKQSHVDTTKIETNSTAKMLAILSYLSALVIPLIGPIALWALKGKEFPFADYHGKQAINMTVTVIIYSAILELLKFKDFVGVVQLVFFLIGVLCLVKASKGMYYKAPFTIRFLRCK